MCLELLVIPAETGQVSADALSTASGLTVTKVNRPAKGAYRFAREPGCSCSLLSDDADWNRPTWDLQNDVLEGLARAVEMVAERAGGLTLQALWIGDQPDTTSRVPLKALLRDIRSNSLKNKHVYRIGRAG
jgi:hypothetical protein